MAAVDVTTDLANATLVVTSVLAATPERHRRLWADPRELERWCGPEPYPATVVDHDLRPGGQVTYFMTSPDGERFKGYWRVVEVEPPHRLAFEDGFANKSGDPNDELPTSRVGITIKAVDSASTRMSLTSVYDTTVALEQVLAMGMEEGIRTGVGQIDALLAEG